MPEPEAAIRKGSVKSGLRYNRMLQPEGAFLELLQIIISLNLEDFLKDHLTEVASISGEEPNIPAENQFNFEEKKKGEDTERNRPTLFLSSTCPCGYKQGNRKATIYGKMDSPCCCKPLHDRIGGRYTCSGKGNCMHSQSFRKKPYWLEAASYPSQNSPSKNNCI